MLVLGNCCWHGALQQGLCLFFSPWSLTSSNAILFLCNNRFMKILVSEAKSDFPLRVESSLHCSVIPREFMNDVKRD